MRVPRHHERAAEVHDQTETPDDEHARGVDGLWRAEPVDRLDDDYDGTREQQHAVAHRDEHFGATESERVPLGRRAQRDPDRPVRHRERDDVGHHVNRVREQRE